MKARIDKYGLLHLERKGSWFLSECPHNPGKSCKDTCPGWTEPIYDWETHGCSHYKDDPAWQGMWLALCTTIGKRYYDSIIDERQKE